jgi:hypothetical protein
VFALDSAGTIAVIPEADHKLSARYVEDVEGSSTAGEHLLKERLLEQAVYCALGQLKWRDLCSLLPIIRNYRSHLN